jgi:hypothetical protein
MEQELPKPSRREVVVQSVPPPGEISQGHSPWLYVITTLTTGLIQRAPTELRGRKEIIKTNACQGPARVPKFPGAGQRFSSARWYSKSITAAVQ